MTRPITKDRLCRFYDRILKYMYRERHDKLGFYDLVRLMTHGIDDSLRLRVARAGFPATDEGVRAAALEHLHAKDASRRRVEQLRRIQVAHDVSGLEAEMIEWRGSRFEQLRPVEEFAILDRDMDTMRDLKAEVVAFVLERLLLDGLRLWQLVREERNIHYRVAEPVALTQAAALFGWASLYVTDEYAGGDDELVLSLGSDRDLLRYSAQFVAIAPTFEPSGNY